MVGILPQMIAILPQMVALLSHIQMQFVGAPLLRRLVDHGSGFGGHVTNVIFGRELFPARRSNADMRTIHLTNQVQFGSAEANRTI
jgi:hypothetical protein